MRPQLFRDSIGMIFCVTSLIVAVPGCDRLDNGPELLESGSSAQEQAAPLVGPAGPTGQAAALVPGSQLDRQQLVALLGNAIPADVGEPCPVINDTCHAPSYTPLTDCGGFTDTCDSSGTQSVLPVVFLCKAIPGGTECKGFVGEIVETRQCSVTTNGRACSTGCGASFCGAYPTLCALETTRFRNCFSNGTCSNDTCANQTVTQVAVGTCERDVEGRHCSPINGCRSPRIGLCQANGVCGCLPGPEPE